MLLELTSEAAIASVYAPAGQLTEPVDVSSVIKITGLLLLVVPLVIVTSWLPLLLVPGEASSVLDELHPVSVRSPTASPPPLTVTPFNVIWIVCASTFNAVPVVKLTVGVMVVLINDELLVMPVPVIDIELIAALMGAGESTKVLLINSNEIASAIDLFNDSFIKILVYKNEKSLTKEYYLREICQIAVRFMMDG